MLLTPIDNRFDWQGPYASENQRLPRSLTWPSSLLQSGWRILTPQRTTNRNCTTRIQAEYREMPGLTLTLPQAARLFNLEPARCERVLDTLVHAGLLVRYSGMYARADCGRRCA